LSRSAAPEKVWSAVLQESPKHFVSKARRPPKLPEPLPHSLPWPVLLSHPSAAQKAEARITPPPQPLHATYAYPSSPKSFSDFRSSHAPVISCVQRERAACYLVLTPAQQFLARPSPQPRHFLERDFKDEDKRGASSLIQPSRIPQAIPRLFTNFRNAKLVPVATL